MPWLSIIGMAVASKPLAVARIVWVCAVASEMVCDRVAREKSAKRKRSVIVRERVEKAELAARRHHQEPVGLGHRAGNLGEELGAGYPDRDGETDALADLAPQPRGDLGRRARDPLEAANIEERLVDRESLD